ncbi:MHYT domain-containing protein [Belnapia rosea]|uniref:MHYT domain-containing protein n=1 Tax=Belnapia rosea TaxID=938405 RepID=UPI000891517C|nr:MHYT domain-containing protein [Belnapia rosea]SDB74833.1 PAS domain S-box-containing protein [Belnapia rosea]
MHPLHSAHEPVLVAVSILIAILGSWTALDLFHRVRANRGPVRLWWLAGAAVATGGSIWSMHFVAMLAYDLGLPVRYEVRLTVVSLLLAIGATGVGYALVAGPAVIAPGRGRIACAALAMGLGICLMHYLGMAAMRMAAMPSYDPLLVAGSVAVAVGASALALFLALNDRAAPALALGALALGLAIAGMHYIAMAAVTFLPMEGPPARPAEIPAHALAIGIAACTLLLLAMALAAAMVDRRIEAMALREAEALRRSEERLRAVLERMPVGVVVTELLSGRVLLVNPEAERILGQRLDDAALDALAATGDALAGALRGGERLEREALLHRRADGVALHLELSAAPVEDRDGLAGLAIATLQDVTARVQAEQVLRRGQRLEAMGQLTGGVAHDFNNLLMVISGNLQLLIRRTGDEVLLRLARSAAEAVRRGSDITRRLLAFSREQPLRPETVDLAAMLPDVVETMLSRTLGGRIRIEVRIAPGVWPVLADLSELQVALLNLAINARDAMPDGGTLTIGAANVASDTLPERLRAGLVPGDYVALSLSDTGTGMPEDVLARAFEPFFTTKDVGRGSGLGLSQVYGFARQSGGTAQLSSRLGQGTRVTLWLPRARPPAAEAVPPGERVA